MKPLKKLIPSIKLERYHYILPSNRIAKYPHKNRSQSNLLVYQKGQIVHRKFINLTEYIPKNSLLVFNQTKVIPARIILKKDTGALIEIFLIQPVWPKTEVSEAMKVESKCIWKCLVGNLKKWKNDQLLFKKNEIKGSFNLQAKLVNREKCHIQFSWDNVISFAECLEIMGKIPLPPYIKREVESLDEDRYQTVYSSKPGAVAAPTAGLHFTEQILDGLKAKGIVTDFITLHVSAGTFQPIKVEQVHHHPMQNEQIVISLNNLKRLMKSDNTIAVGTTSMRTVESLFWFGVQLIEGNTEFKIEKLYPYKKNEVNISVEESMTAIKNYMIKENLMEITGETEIFILPGYRFKICKGLITNFHLPKSTLILLVAAFIGDDWINIYKEALDNNYQFLSYGDASLLIP